MGLKKRTPTRFRYSLFLRRHTTPGRCWVSENRKPCLELATPRTGLCGSHRTILQKRKPSVFEPNRTVLPGLEERMRSGIQLRRKKRIPHGTCCVMQDGQGCRATLLFSREACRFHYYLLKLRKQLAILPPRRPRQLTAAEKRQLHKRKGRCLYDRDGGQCQEVRYCRGMCTHHYNRLVSDGTLEQVAPPPKQPGVLTINKRAPPGRCHIVDDGKSCRRPCGWSGVCAPHQLRVNRRADLAKDDFYLPRLRPTYRAKGRAKVGECRVVESRPTRSGTTRTIRCREPAKTRGLCKVHYTALRNSDPSNLDAVAEPSSTRVEYSLDPAAPPGRCRVRVDEKNCGARAAWSGVCTKHQRALRGMGVIDQFARERPTNEFHRKTITTPGTCVVIERNPERGDLPCSHSPSSRGVCDSHVRRIRYRDRALYERIADPAKKNGVDLSDPKAAGRYEVNPDAPPRACRVVDRGNPCLDSCGWSGVCLRHGKQLRRRGWMERFKRPPPTFRYRRREGVPPTRCVVIEVRPDGSEETCQRSVAVRGLCENHYGRLRYQGRAQLEEIADPQKVERR